MENMNLASRCREAITHVAMLKKELLVNQRRAEEAAQLQRQPIQPAHMTETDQAIGSPPPQQVSPDNGSPEAPEQNLSSTPFGSSGASRVLEAKAAREMATRKPPVSQSMSVAKPAVDNFADDEEEEGPADEFQSEEVASSFEKEAFFGEEPGRPAQHLPATPEKEDVDGSDAFPPVSETVATTTTGAGAAARQVNAQQQKRKLQKGVDPDIGRPPSPVFSNAAMVKARTEMSTMSSIDAFEKSFDTTFPTSFATAQKEGPAPSLDISFDVPEFSDPFYLGSDGDGGNIAFPGSHGPRPSNGSSSGPARPIGVDTTPAAPSARGYTGATSPHPTAFETQTRDTPTAGRVQSASPTNDTASSSAFSPALFPSSPMSELKQRPNDAAFVKDDGLDELAPRLPDADEVFHTPAINGTAAHGTLPQAPGPEKNGAAAARARYDAALGPAKVEEEARPRSTSAPKSPGNPASIKSKRGVSNSASMVLQKLQQRRAKNGNADAPTGAASPSEQGPPATPTQNVTASPSTQFSPYGAASGAASSGDAKLAAIRNSARRQATGEVAARVGGTVDGDYGPRRKSANTYGGGRGDDNLAMFRATNPSSATSKYRSATSRTSGHRLSPKSMEAEMNGLDALAAQAGAASAAPSTKAPTSATSTEASGGVGRRPNRSVNQPVSYAEPSLSSKIRKGHDFFPKGADGVGGPSTRVVSPAASPAMRQQPL